MPRKSAHAPERLDNLTIYGGLRVEFGSEYEDRLHHLVKVGVL